MENLDIILWVMGGGYTLIFGLMLVMWNSLNQKIDNIASSLNERISNSEKILSARMDKLDEKMTDIDRRLCRLEGAFASKDCCMIKDERHLRKTG